MYFVRPPVPLWFLIQGEGITATSAAVCVSVTYQISVSVGAVDSVDYELSALIYALSVTHDDPGENDFARSVQVGIDLNDAAFGTPDLKLSVTPVFVLEQSGGISKDATISAQVSISVTASIFVDAQTSSNYQVSASIAAVVSVEGQLFICVSSNYQISASTGVLLNVQLAQEDKAFAAEYRASIVVSPLVNIVNLGGLVWSQKKQKYIPVRIGDLTNL